MDSTSNVLVTGGSGLIGGHLVEELLKKNVRIFVLKRSLDPQSYFMTQGYDKKVILLDGDLKDKQRIADIISNKEISYVFHLAAQAIVTTALETPVETLETNINGTINILEACRACKRVKGIVVASSDKAYGKSDVLPYKEDMPLKGEYPYEVSKSCADLISQMYAKTYELPVAITRFGNIYGPGDLNFSRIIPGAIQCALDQKRMEIRSDGKMVREYVYVKDVVEGYLMLMDNIDQTKGQAFNFSSGEKLAVLEVIDAVGQAIGRPIETTILNTAKYEIAQQYLSYEKAKTLGWQPRTTIAMGLIPTIAWYKQVRSIQ